MKPISSDEVLTARRVLSLASCERSSAVIVILLAMVSALFEGIGLSFLVPLAGIATGRESLEVSAPFIGAILQFLNETVGVGPLGIVALVVGFFLLGISVSFANHVFSNMVAMRFAHDLRVRIFERALTEPISKLESLAPGKFVNNLAGETWRVCDAFFVLIRIAVDATIAVMFVGFLLSMSPLYTAIMALMAIVMAIAVHFSTRVVRQLGETAVDANESFMRYVWDALSGLRTIRGFGHEAHERRRFYNASDRVSDVFTRLSIVSGTIGPITQVMTILMVGTLLSVSFARGESFPTMVGFLAIAYRLQPRISSLLGSRTQLRALTASVAEISRALDEAPQERVRASGAFSELRRGVTVHQVSARYPNAERSALRDVSCSFEYGKVTAIAGHSGAGKSTLVALLLRFLSPESGKIYVDGMPLSSINPERWHQRIAFVEQDAFLFNASVRENIGYGDLSANLEAIKAAARMAQADEFISSLPQGYDTLIGDSGVRVSQGQRQRIALARSLLRKPDVLILDEAMNSLDRPTERALRAAIDTGRSTRAVIVIAHRRETIESADYVIVIDDGTVVQAGPPADLARQPGVYARLYLDGSPVQSTESPAQGI